MSCGTRAIDVWLYHRHDGKGIDEHHPELVSILHKLANGDPLMHYAQLVRFSLKMGKDPKTKGTPP